MVVFKRKSRMISFRLSEEEYAILRRASLSNGARSVSDFARDTLFGVLNGAPTVAGPAALETKVEKLTSDMEVLTQHIHHVRKLLDPDGREWGRMGNV